MEKVWFVDVVTRYGPGCEHSVPVHVALEQCAEIMNAEYIAVVDQNCPHSIGSEKWLRTLRNHREAASCGFVELTKQRKYYLAFAEIKSIFSEFFELWTQTRSLLKGIKNNAAYIIVYLDFATPRQQLAIALSLTSLVSITNKSIVWIHFHRIGWPPRRRLDDFCEGCLRILPIKIWGTAYTSEIAAENSKYGVVDILPQPLNPAVNEVGIHSKNINVIRDKINVFIDKSDKLVCWLFLNREEQGLELLPRMIDHRSARNFPKKFIKCFVSEKVSVKDNAEIELVRLPYLSQEDYRLHFNECEVVLLPYNADSFSGMMSSVFLEAVVTSKIVIVSDGTVMAKELRRFELGDLVVNFNDDFSWGVINQIRNDTSVRARLKLMTESYVGEHNTLACAQSLYKSLKRINSKMPLSEPKHFRGCDDNSCLSQ